MTQRYPSPITAAMLAVANPNAGKPRYDAASLAADWFGGQFGNEVDQAEAMQAIANSHSANVETDYDPQHQKAKANDMVPPLTILTDLGKDYGFYSGATGRAGTIQPKQPYPDATTAPPAVTSLSPATGLAAGGTAVTLTGTGFTGATSVKFGATAATAVVVVNPTTITCTSPAHTAGTVDVQVTTPNGASATGSAGDNFVYT